MQLRVAPHLRDKEQTWEGPVDTRGFRVHIGCRVDGEKRLVVLLGLLAEPMGAFVSGRVGAGALTLLPDLPADGLANKTWSVDADETLEAIIAVLADAGIAPRKERTP